MAQQKGIIKLKGTIGDITFYKTKDGHMGREKGGVAGKRIASSYVRFAARGLLNEFNKMWIATARNNSVRTFTSRSFII